MEDGTYTAVIDRFETGQDDQHLAVLLVEGDALERALKGRRDARRLTRLQELIRETS